MAPGGPGAPGPRRLLGDASLKEFPPWPCRCASCLAAPDDATHHRALCCSAGGLGHARHTNLCMELLRKASAAGCRGVKPGRHGTDAAGDAPQVAACCCVAACGDHAAFASARRATPARLRKPVDLSTEHVSPTRTVSLRRWCRFPADFLRC